jgi:hypothetical protein
MAKAAAAVDKITYEELYKRWEHANWRATDIDFSQDRHDWHETFTDLERQAALWNYSLFFHGEDSVTDNLSPYIDAAPLEEQKYFLATQQVDEARHAVFFGRFMREVVERGETYGGSLAATRPELTWGFRKTFEKLDKVADGLRRDRSIPNLAAALAMYHIIVESTLAVPGQHFIESYVTERGILPGFGKGMRNVSKDEQRHIGFGVKMLADLNRQDPEVPYAVADLIRDVISYTSAVFVPPNWDRRYVEVFGSTVEDVFEEGMTSFDQKMRTAGLPLEELPGPPPIPFDIPPRARAERAIALLQAGILGEKTGPVAKDPEVVELLFDVISRTVDTSQTPDGQVTIQWDFKDAEPWHLRIANGDTSAERGRLEDADLTLRCRFEDWADIVGRREDPRFAIAKGKLRPKGSIRTLLRMRKLFGR